MLYKVGSRPAFDYQKVNKKQAEDNKQLSTALNQNSKSIAIQLDYLSNINRAKLLSFGSQDENSRIEENFKTLRPFELDNFQQRAVDAMIKENKDAILTAPTGVGKTAVAERVIQHNIKNGERTIYTSPLKALSEEKVRQFKDLFGEDNVGIHTGDRKQNPDAKVVLMTTEVYNNIVSSPDTQKGIGTDQLKGVKTVIFDEFHYIGDRFRGHVWENSVMDTPKNIQMLAMSATIGHPERVKNWFEGIRGAGSAELVEIPKEERPVKLKTYVFSPAKIDKNSVITSTDKTRHISMDDKGKTKLQDSKNGKQIFTARDSGNNFLVKSIGIGGLIGLMHTTVLPNSELTEADRQPGGNKSLLPAGIFRFNKKDCDEMKSTMFTYMQGRKIFRSGATEEDKENGIEEFSLLNVEEQKRLNKILNEYKEKNKYLGQDYDEEGLKKGIAVHHAGIMPEYKGLIERLGNEKLVKVVFTTETLAAGINLPIRSVVLTQYNKHTDGIKEGIPLTSNEINQIAGRAGRRGKDVVGHVIFLNDRHHKYTQALSTLKDPADDITSHYSPTYNLVLSQIAKGKSKQEMVDSLDNSFIPYSFDVKDPKEKEDKVKLEKEISADHYTRAINTLEEKGYILRTDEEGQQYKLDEKGMIASKIKGTNEILLTEAITGGVFDNLSPAELGATVAAIVTPAEKPKKAEEEEPEEDEEQKKKIFTVSNNKIQETLNKLQAQGYLPIRGYSIHSDYSASGTFNKRIVNAMETWSNPALPSDENYQFWKDTVKVARSDKAIKHEGDLFMIANRTANLLKQISRATQDTNPELSKNAKIAYKTILKPPVQIE